MALPGSRLRTLHLFAGAGGGILADLILGHVPVCAVELDAYCRRVLLARQRDGSLPRFPIWDDVRTFDGRPWGGAVDVVSGGFPCTDISAAGRGAGIDGEASGLWSEMARIIGEVRPRYSFVENSPILTSRGLGRVLGDLAEMGFDARWGVLGAADVGAPHQRDRIWIVATHAGRVERLRESQWLPRGAIPAIADHDGGEELVAHADRAGREWPRQAQPAGRLGDTVAAGTGAGMADSEGDGRDARRTRDIAEESRGRESGRSDVGGDLPDADGERREEQRRAIASGTELAPAECGGRDWWSRLESDLGREVDELANGLDEGPRPWGPDPWGEGWEDGVPRTVGAKDVADRPARLKAIGNGQVPLCAAAAWRLLR